MFRRIAIVNRGEPAMRLIHAVAELNAERETDAEGRPERRIETVALFTDVDAGATYVRAADRGYCLGPAAARPYLDLAVLERALAETGADAAWPGWGFVAEDPAFAGLCRRLAVTFIGPGQDAMRKLGDKIGAKLLAEQSGVPVAPWSRGPVPDLAAALKAAERIGYPLMLKAAAGGGGRGIRVVTGPDDLTEAFDRTATEAEHSFGSGVLFLESLLTGARHVEVQVIADGQGTAWALGVRDCSVQRRNQKIIEESSSPVLTAAQAGQLKDSAERLAVAVGYRGAGTVEFLYRPRDQRFTFLEVNTRLQVEHPVTEVTTGIDLVKAQLHVAAGRKLTGPRPAERGHAIEARLNAEDADRDFAPAPGRIALLGLPAGPGIRVDTGVSEGDAIPGDFDSMIAKIIAAGSDRDEALARLRRAIRDTTVLIEGGTTNKSFLLDLLDAREVADASADTGWIDRVRAEGRLAQRRHRGVALAAAAIADYQEQKLAEVRRLLSTAHGGRPQVQHQCGRPVALTLRGVSCQLTVVETGPARYRVGFVTGAPVAAAGMRPVDVTLDRFDEHTAQIYVNGSGFRLVTGVHGAVRLVEVDGVTHRIGRDEGGLIRSPAPAMVVATPLTAGDEVAAGAPVLVLESMKMETVLRAPFRAVVKELLVSPGSQAGAGDPLVQLEPAGAAAAAPDTADDDLDLPAEDAAAPAENAERAFIDLRSRLLGYDIDPNDSGATLAAYLADRTRQPRHRALAAETELIEIFAGLCELSRSKPDGAQTGADTLVHSPREHFHAYLQSLDAKRAGLSEEFTKSLTKVLGYYGVHQLDRSPALEEAVFRVFLAQRQAGSSVAMITALLQGWLTEPPPPGRQRRTVVQALERLISVSAPRYPAVSDLARSLVFRWFARPLLRRTRAGVYSRVRRQLRRLDQHPDAASRIADTVPGAEPLVRLLCQHSGQPGPDATLLLEALTRRYYREHGLSAVRAESIGGRPFVTGGYEFDGKAQSLVATVAGFGELAVVAETAARLAGSGLAGARPASSALVLDIYLTWPDQPADADDLAAAIRERLSAAALPGELRRITTTVAGRHGGPAHHHLTFQSAQAGPATAASLTEERLIRGLQPPIAQWLQLWRLKNFELTRLPATDEDVCLLRCVAPKNPHDERLVAMAQVRDLTPLRDADGAILALPVVEGVLGACVDAIREARAHRPARERLDTNRIVVYVWPPSHLTPAELTAVAQRIGPATAGAGVEEILFLGRQRDQRTGTLKPVAARLSSDGTAGIRFTLTDPPRDLIQPLDDYGQKVLRARRRGGVYPYELIGMIAGPGGRFTEYDLDDSGVLVPAGRPRGLNKAGIVAGVATTPTRRYPEGITRVALLGDPTKALGALSEPECARVIAALDLASRLEVPVEWYTLSAGARIAMDSGTENMDWIAAALRRIVLFTQQGGEINVVVAGVNVGAQPYWNAEATMLMHTRGILVMTPDSAMVLTGKQSLDVSGGVSAEDNAGIGGYDRVMGPNGQAQYWAPDLRAAHGVLLAHYDHSYVLPGEDGPRPAATEDPADRDICWYPHPAAGSDFSTVGEIFSADANPERKKPFDIRTVLRALADQDHPVLERWAGMADAETAVVQDAHLGGRPVCLVGIESRPLPRRGFPPADGPETYTAGTLFPLSSKKVARAINAASGNRPLVVLANLSGFDGSPESMRKLQLEYGAEIGRAIVNFRGPIVFCVISRYHGGAFVVFSKALHPDMTVLAVDGSYASVLGGAPAAAVVFAADVRERTAADPRVTELEARLAAAPEAERAALTARAAELRATVRAEKLAEVAGEFDNVHSIQRAQQVGSVDEIIAPAELRPRIIAAVENGLARVRARGTGR